MENSTRSHILHLQFKYAFRLLLHFGCDCYGDGYSDSNALRRATRDLE